MRTQHNNPETGRRGARRRGGVTLVELLVVVSIIVVLSGLIMGGAAAFFKSQKEQNTVGVMGQAMLTATLVAKRSAIPPDHRLANFFWVQPHTADIGTSPVFNAATARRMSSMEFFSFLALSMDASGKMLRIVGGNHLKAPLPPASWPATWTGGGRTWPDAKGNLLVDVFQQNASQQDIQFKASCPTTVQGIPTLGTATYTLMSGTSGYQFLSLFDGWGYEIAFRSYAHPDILNGGNAYYTLAPTNGQSWTDLESITGDEQASPASVDKGTGPLRPAVAASTHPYFFSCGPDGAWGAFKDAAVRDGQDDPSSARDAGARDNLYSFDREGR